MDSPVPEDTSRLEILLQRYARAVPIVPHATATTHRHEDNANDPNDGGWMPEDTARALAGCSFDTYLGLKFYHSDPLPQIEQAWRGMMTAASTSSTTNTDANLKFRDFEFPTHTPIQLIDPATGTPHATALVGAAVAPGIITSSNIRDLTQSGQDKRVRRIQHFLQHATGDWYWLRASDMPSHSLFDNGTATKTTPTPPTTITARALFASESWSHSIHARTVVQGRVGNCGFCSALASVAASVPHVIHHAFGERSAHSLPTCGAYSLQMFLPGISSPRYLLLDDSVLCTRRRPNEQRHEHEASGLMSPSIQAAISSNGASAVEDLWPRLLEKAFVKVQGSYASLDGFYKYNSLYRHPGRALQLLTGCSLAFELHWNDTMSSQPVYDTLVATQDRYARVAHCRRNRHGLHSNHGYSLLWVGHVAVEVDTCVTMQQLTCLRNPHGRGSYVGPSYGVQSEIWRTPTGQQVVAQLRQLECFGPTENDAEPGVTWRRPVNGQRPVNGNNKDCIPSQSGIYDDGIFFMGFEAFVKCFPVVTVVGPLPTTPTTTTATSSPTVQSHHQRSTTMSRPDCIYQIHSSELSHAVEIVAAANAAQVGSPSEDGRP